MSQDIAISVKDVTKRFRLFRSPKERLLEALHPLRRKYHREFWALRGVSFDVRRGETFAIVGRNGSGKSTLLQILCGVLRATGGQACANGRISALLELGAGYNPELTGRQNTYLAGALQGFSRREMDQRLPMIEEFAEIGEFIDQPVKTYSSGMFVRLAFAGAINVDPDILVVDEALAVGDAKFQHKCFQKFREFQEQGKTILMVTHSTAAVTKHCQRALLLEAGEMVEIGPPNDVVNCYIDLLFSGQISGYAAKPEVVAGEHRGHLLVRGGARFYALPLQGASWDPETLTNQQLRDLAAAGRCIAEGTKEAIVRRLNDAQAAQAPAAPTPTAGGSAALAEFLAAPADADACPRRRTYNPNEYRYGDRRALIVDYLVACGGDFDPVAIQAGSTLEVYVKIRFAQSIDRPMCGFTIKTVDGVILHGRNTEWSRASFPAVKASQVIVWKITVKMPLRDGDYFIDLGCGEADGAVWQPLDRRYGLIHLVVQGSSAFGGLVELDSRLVEVSRT